MVGIPPWSQPGTNGGGQKVAVSNRPEIEVVSADQTADLAAGSSQTTEIYAPVGSVYSPVNFYLDVAGTGGTGTGHSFLVESGTAATSGTSNPSTNLVWQFGYWKIADKAAHPPSDDAQLDSVQAMRATENSPIKVKYYNNTGANQTDSRLITFEFEEVSY